MRKTFEKPIAEVVHRSVHDIITTSPLIEIPSTGNIPDNGGIVPDFDQFV